MRASVRAWAYGNLCFVRVTPCVRYLWELMGTHGNFVRSNSVRACVGTYGNL